MGEFNIAGGHNAKVPGAFGCGRAEHVEDRKIKDRVIQMLRENGHKANDCTDDVSSSSGAELQGECNRSNQHRNAQCFVAIHLNSFGKPSANGIETFSITASGNGYKYSKAVQAELVKASGMFNRGCKTAGFKVLRDTSAPAILVELGFISNQGDMNKFNVEKLAAAIFKGLTGTTYKAPAPVVPENGKMKRVVTGSFSSKENAKRRVTELKRKGFSSFLDAYKTNVVMYRVVTGSYSNQANADKQVAALKAKGFDSFIQVV